MNNPVLPIMEHLAFSVANNSTNPVIALTEALAETPALPVKIGVKIKTIRLQKHMTQNQLATVCDFEKASMSRIESGQSNPTLRTLNKISNALEVPLVELFY